jgi:hypothetical protein
MQLSLVPLEQLSPYTVEVLEKIAALRQTPALNGGGKNYGFGVYHQGNPVCVTYWPSEFYNHPVRYNVDIRDMSQDIMRDFRRVIGSRNDELTFLTADAPSESGFGGDYDLLRTGSVFDALPNDAFKEGYSVRLTVGDKTVVERRFAVHSGNRAALSSVELTELVQWWAGTINAKIKQADINFMYDEQLLSRRLNLTPRDIRAMKPVERQLALDEVRKNQA